MSVVAKHRAASVQRQRQSEQPLRQKAKQRDMALFSYLQMAVSQPLDLLMRGRITQQRTGSTQLSDTPAGADAGTTGTFGRCEPPVPYPG